MAQTSVIWSVSDLFISSGLENYYAKPVDAMPMWLRPQKLSVFSIPLSRDFLSLKERSSTTLIGLSGNVNNFFTTAGQSHLKLFILSDP